MGKKHKKQKTASGRKQPLNEKEHKKIDAKFNKLMKNYLKNRERIEFP